VSGGGLKAGVGGLRCRTTSHGRWQAGLATGADLPLLRRQHPLPREGEGAETRFGVDVAGLAKPFARQLCSGFALLSQVERPRTEPLSLWLALAG
jgi:hypothetical protein